MNRDPINRPLGKSIVELIPPQVYKAALKERDLTIDKLKICLEDCLNWFESRGAIDGVYFDEESVASEIRKVLGDK